MVLVRLEEATGYGLCLHHGVVGGIVGSCLPHSGGDVVGQQMEKLAQSTLEAGNSGDLIRIPIENCMLTLH
jgi:hypothetical protein